VSPVDVDTLLKRAEEYRVARAAATEAHAARYSSAHLTDESERVRTAKALCQRIRASRSEPDAL
jgi:CRP-like cAMP-binding protein